MIMRRFAGVLAAAAFLAAVAQTSAAESYVLPAPVTGVTGGPGFPGGFQFCPLGWSADGKFAWLESRDIDGRGGTIYTYIIYDAVEDMFVFSRSDDSFDWGTDLEATEEESWKRSGNEVSAALSKYGIVQSRSITVEPFPLQRDGDSYTASLEIQNVPPTNESDEERVQSYALVLGSRTRGSKTVSTRDGLGAMKVWIDGYILSPLEPRILLVVSVQTRAFEGYEESLYFFGAHLRLGFRK
jgi:hypothetical protein